MRYLNVEDEVRTKVGLSELRRWKKEAPDLGGQGGRQYNNSEGPPGCMHAGQTAPQAAQRRQSERASQETGYAGLYARHGRGTGMPLLPLRLVAPVQIGRAHV